MWRMVALSCIAALAVPCAAEAGSLTLENYRNAKGAYSAYFDGVKEGIIASLAMTPEGARPFCIPGNLALTVEQADDIMLRYAEDHEVKGDMLVSLILFVGLKDTFPCPAKK